MRAVVEEGGLRISHVQDATWSLFQQLCSAVLKCPAAKATRPFLCQPPQTSGISGAPGALRGFHAHPAPSDTTHTGRLTPRWLQGKEGDSSGIMAAAKKQVRPPAPLRFLDPHQCARSSVAHRACRLAEEGSGEHQLAPCARDEVRQVHARLQDGAQDAPLWQGCALSNYCNCLACTTD